MIKTIQIKENKDLDLMLAYAQEAGFREISFGFDGAADSLLFQDDYQKSIDTICEMLDKYHLRCVQTHLPAPYHLLVSSEKIDEKAEAAIKRGIQATAALGATWGAYHPRTAISDGYNRKLSYEHNKNMLTQYLEEAEKSGVGIAVENMPLYPYTCPEWRFFGGGYEELCELCDDLKSDKIGICWDFGHAHTAAINQNIALNYIGKRMKITHVHDNYRNGDHHLLPLQGGLEWKCIDWGKVMPALKDIDYNGPLTLETLFPPLPMLKSFMQLSHACLSCLVELA